MAKPEPSEASIVRRIKTALKDAGWRVWKNHGSAYSEPGLPDLMAIRDGKFVAIEVKRPRSGRLSAAQTRWIKKIEEQGHEALVARSVDDVRHLCDGEQ